MPISQQVRSFTGGEWSPDLWQRDDLERFTTANQICRNCIPQPTGGVQNRWGLYYAGQTRFGATQSGRLWTFMFSTQQAFGLCFENKILRFWMNGGQLLAGTVSAYNGATVYSQGMTASSGGVNYVYINTTPTSGNSPPNATYWYALQGSGSTSPYEIPTPYGINDLPLLKFSQSADTLIISSPSFPPYKLTRTANTTWQMTQIAFGPKQQPPTSLTTTITSGTTVYALTAIAASGEESILSNTVTNATNGTTLNWTAASGAVAYNLYQQVYGSWGWLCQFGAVTSADLTKTLPAISTLSPAFTKGPPTSVSYFGSTNNYPSCSVFSAGRLIWGNTNNSPQDFFGSTIANFFSFNTSTPAQANDGFDFPISTTNNGLVNAIQFIIPCNMGTFFYTDGGEFLAVGSNGSLFGGGGWGPTSPPNLIPQSNWGVWKTVRPILAGRTIIFVDRTGKCVRDQLYQFQFNGYDTNDLTVMANHLFQTGTVKSWCFVQHPKPIIHAVTSDGRWLTLAYSLDRGQYVIAWHRHDTVNGTFEDVTGVPNTDGTTTVYFIVKRTINGSTVRYIETFGPRVFTDHWDGFFVDCGLTYNSPIAITGVSKANPCVITAPGHGLSNGNRISIRNIVATPVKVKNQTTGTITSVSPMQTNLNWGKFSVTVIDANTFSLYDTVDGPTSTINSTNWDSYTSGGEIRLLQSTFSAPQLAGEQVVALADGVVATAAGGNPLTVSGGGSFTLDNPAGFVSVGKPITWQIKPMRFSAPAKTGSTIDKAQTIPEAFVRVYQTRSLYAAPNENKDPDPVNLMGTDPGGQLDASGVLQLVTGIARVPLRISDSMREGTTMLTSSDPCPTTVLDMIPRVNYGNG